MPRTEAYGLGFGLGSLLSGFLFHGGLYNNVVPPTEEMQFHQDMLSLVLLIIVGVVVGILVHRTGRNRGGVGE